MKINNKHFSIFALLIIITLFTTCTTPAAVDDDGSIRIGVLLPFSGAFSEYGESSRNSIELYLDEVNRSGGVDGREIRYFVEDTAWDPETAAKKARKLINQNKVQAILGPLGSRTSIAAGKICQQRNISMICIAATLEGVTEIGNFIFRTSIIEDYQVFIIAKFAIESLYSTKATVISFSDDALGEGWTKLFENQYRQLGGRATQHQNFDPDQTKWGESIEAIEDFQPDVVFFPVFPDRAEEIISRIRELGIDAIPLGLDLWTSINPDRKLFEGSYFVDHYSPKTYEEQSRKFVAAYEQRFGPLGDSIPALAYESVVLLVNAFQDARSLDPSAVREALQNTDIETLIGRFRFDEIGDPVKPAIIKQVKSGEIGYVVSIYPEVVTEETFKEQVKATVSGKREDLPLVAVMDLSLSSIPKDEAGIIVDLIGSALANTGAFRILERGKRDQMLKELEFSYSDMADENYQIEIGKQLAADRIVTGSLGALAERFILNIKLIDVKLGETLSASYQVYKSMNDLIDNADRLVIDLASKTEF